MSRETETRVFILDQAQLEKLARAQAITVYGMSEEEVARLICIPQALIRQGEGTDGDFAVIGTEGVGMKNGKYSRVVEIFAGTMTMIDYYQVRLHEYQLSKMVLDAVPLAEYIRVHNDRLESNFEQWSRWAREVPAK